MSTREIALSFVICALMAALEGAMAGGGVKQRFASLRFPPGSPTLPVWIAIGALYYAMCFVVVYRLLMHGLTDALAQSAFALVLAVMVYNAAWNWLFFRRRDLRASFLSFIPYAMLIAGLIVCLLKVDRWAAAALTPYLAYLFYATWWGYRVWQLNRR